MFINRQQAGSLLAKEIANHIEQHGQFDKDHTVVLGLPRGGVPVALEIALALNCPLNVITSKKIGAPDQSELAVGAVTADGVVVIDEKLTEHLGISPVYIEKERDYLADKTKKLEQTVRRSAGLEVNVDLREKQVIVVDDGVATGMTAIAAARSLRGQGAKTIIFVTPVISRRAYFLLRQEYDQVIGLEIPEDFQAVGQFYIDFSQVNDGEVVSALTLAKNREVVSEFVR